MLKLLIVILSILMLAQSCLKKPIINDWNIDLKISVNSALTDSIQTQIITITKNAPLEDYQEFRPIFGAIMHIEQAGTIYNFSGTDSSAYLSDVPFALTSGQDFTIKYEIDTAFLTTNYFVPFPIGLKKIVSEKNQSALKIFVEVASPTQQFFYYKIYDQTVLANANGIFDTSWFENRGTKPFQFAEVEAGEHEVLLMNDSTRYSGNDSGKVVKIELTPISKTVKDYFVKVNTYYETVATYNLYVNAPRFYSNHFYGITYATSWTSLTDSL